MATEKKTATFIQWLGVVDTGGGICAQLGDVVHPRLGAQRTVTTSHVERLKFGEDGYPCLIETRNTRYVREVGA